MSAKRQIQDGSLRSVGRAVELLRSLNQRAESTLHDLHRDTGLPKPSIVRLLRTLEAKNLATRSAGYGIYQLLGRVKSLSSGFHHQPLIIEAAESLMVDFTRREGWPLTLAFFEVDAMVVRVSTIRHTSLWIEESPLNQRLSVVSHALGRAHLAFAAANERKFLIEILKQSIDPDDAGAHDPSFIAELTAQVRARGYATGVAGEQRSSTVAVPIFDGDRVVACIGLTWITAAMSEKKAIAECVPSLRRIAGEISDALARRVPKPANCAG